MDKTTAHILCDINTAFYHNNAPSFSVTRTEPWHGWKECARLFEEHGTVTANNASKASVFDLACGNLRFEEYLCERFPQASFSFFAVDNCEPLLPTINPFVNNVGFLSNPRCNLRFQNLDVVNALLNKMEPLDSFFQKSPCENLCDVSVSFGFMHHIPSRKLRLKFLNEAMSLIKNGSYLIVSFWQFLKNDSLKQKANKKTDLAIHTYNIDKKELEDGDCFLGWQDKENIFRYCHNFSNKEIDSYIEYLSKFGRLHTSFEADGKSDDLNFYIVMQKN